MNKKQSLTDHFIIRQCLEGNTSQLPVLVKRYHKTFCEKAFWITKDKEIAKDIAQESWIIILNSLHTLKHIDSFKSWAFRIIYTKAIDAVKQRNKIKKNLASSRNIEFAPESSGSDQNHIQAELLKAIQKLPKEKQDIIRLFYAEEYSINEISAFLSIPTGTVKSRLFKAREKLKSILRNERTIKCTT